MTQSLSTIIFFRLTKKILQNKFPHLFNHENFMTMTRQSNQRLKWILNLKGPVDLKQETKRLITQVVND
jgi:hypothetical protein